MEINKLMQHVVDKFAKDFDNAAVTSLVEQRVLEERERCAQIAENVTSVFSGPQLRMETWNLCKDFIASKIRNPHAH